MVFADNADAQNPELRQPPCLSFHLRLSQKSHNIWLTSSSLLSASAHSFGESLCVLQLQVLNYTHLLHAAGDRKCASSHGSCWSQMLYLQARLADEKGKFFTEILQEKDVNKLSLWHWISRSSLTWLEMPFQVRLAKQEAIVPRTFHWTLTVPSLNNIGMQSTFSNHNSIGDELGFIYSASASASNNCRGDVEVCLF